MAPNNTKRRFFALVLFFNTLHHSREEEEKTAPFIRQINKEKMYLGNKNAILPNFGDFLKMSSGI